MCCADPLPLRIEQALASFGFRRESEDYDEDGIPHLEMVRVPNASVERRAQSAENF